MPTARASAAMDPPEPATATRPARAVGVLLTVLPFVIAAVVTFFAFFPGHANGDTGGIYLQARGQVPVNNWHPTMNVVILYSLFQVWDSPAAVLAFQCALIWGGLALSALALRRRFAGPVALFLVPIGFMPVVFNYIGALIKDTLSAGFTLVAIAVLLVERVATKGNRVLLLAAVVCLWFAFVVKYPALPIVAALSVYAAARWWGGRSRPVVIFATAVTGGVMLVACAASPLVLDRVVDARDTNVEQAVQLFDLAGITHFSGENAFGEPLLADEQVDEFVDGVCYDPAMWETLAWYGACSFVSDSVESVSGTDILFNRWRDGIIDQPVDYARHRLNHMGTFSWRPGRYQLYYDYGDAQLDWSPNRNVVMDAYRGVISRTDTWPQRRPLFWQAASVVLLGVLLRRRWARRAGPFDPVLMAAMGGNVLFYLSWLFVGVAVEFRYSYTVIITCLLTVATLLIQAVATARRPSRAAHGIDAVGDTAAIPPSA